MNIQMDSGTESSMANIPSTGNYIEMIGVIP